MRMYLKRSLKDAQKAYKLETKTEPVVAEVVNSPIKLVEEVKKEEASNKSSFKRFAVVILAAIVIAIVVFAIGCDKAGNEGKVDGNSMFLQVAGNNDQYRVDGDFEAKYAAAIKDAANLSKAQEKLLLENAANNARRLAIWANAFGLYDNPNDVLPLLTSDKKYLSEEGVSLYYKLEGALSGCILKEGKAPSDGYNSGVSDGTYVTAQTSGISGNRSAIVATLPNGEKVYIMIRCGNVVTPSKPDLPEGPTDEKSSDPADYKQPGDDGTVDSGTGVKPKAEVTTPAESKPAAVVTDSSKPGEETTVTAPGATTSDPDRTVPTPEPGTAPDDGSPNDTDPGLPAGF